MPEPPRKRARLVQPPRAPLEARLSEELIVHCLSFLEDDDLARCARLSQKWNRLANEPALWRSLFIRKFAPRRRRASLPEQRRSWKELYKIQTRWLEGKARSTALDLRASVLEEPPLDLNLEGEETSTVHSAPNTIVRFSGQHVYVACRSTALVGTFPAVEVHVHHATGTQPLTELRPASLIAREPLSITEMTLDEAKAGRLAVFYSNGQFAIFEVHHDSWQEIFAGSKQGQAIALAKLQSPLLVTCSSEFAITFTSVTEPKMGSSRLTLRKLASPLRTPLCWSPLVLSLRALEPDQKQFRVNVVHSAPHFPQSWTVVLHEFDIDLSAPFGERIVARQVTASPMSPALITAIEYRPPWLVASRADNTLDVFLVRSSPPGEPALLALEHWRTLFGHTAGVKTLSLGKGGRCVSGGHDGRIKVWALAEPHAAAVTVLSEEDEKRRQMPPPPTVSWLGFDDEKIVMVSSPTRRSGERAREQEDVHVLSFD